MKGATLQKSGLVLAYADFNPRSREGSDRRVAQVAHDLGISIHAPVKGATGWRWTPTYGPANFNPRSREGSDNTYKEWII